MHDNSKGHDSDCENIQWGSITIFLEISELTCVRPDFVLDDIFVDLARRPRGGSKPGLWKA